MAPTKQMDPVAAMTKALTGYDELVALGKDNMAAVMAANEAAMAGVQRLNGEVASYLKTAYEANLAAANAMASSKTLEEAVTLQSGHVKASLETALTKGRELSEVALAVAEEVAEPLQARSKATMDKLMTPLAA